MNAKDHLSPWIWISKRKRQDIVGGINLTFVCVAKGSPLTYACRISARESVGSPGLTEDTNHSWVYMCIPWMHMGLLEWSFAEFSTGHVMKKGVRNLTLAKTMVSMWRHGAWAAKGLGHVLPFPLLSVPVTLWYQIGLNLIPCMVWADDPKWAKGCLHTATAWNPLQLVVINWVSHWACWCLSMPLPRRTSNMRTSGRRHKLESRRMHDNHEEEKWLRLSRRSVGRRPGATGGRS